MNRLLRAPHSHSSAYCARPPERTWVPSGHRSWEVLGRFVAGDKAIRGNLIPDAHLAATAVAHGCRLATTDRGFARYPGLRWFDPATAPPT